MGIYASTRTAQELGIRDKCNTSLSDRSLTLVMMNTVIKVVPTRETHVRLTFADGFEAEVDLKPLLTKGIALEVVSAKRFTEVTTEPGGGIAWPNGFDLCPQMLRELAEKRQAAA
jgi:hypothetical protein